MKKQFTVRLDEEWIKREREKNPECDHLSLGDWIVFRVMLGYPPTIHDQVSDQLQVNPNPEQKQNGNDESDGLSSPLDCLDFD